MTVIKGHCERNIDVLSAGLQDFMFCQTGLLHYQCILFVAKAAALHFYTELYSTVSSILPSKMEYKVLGAGETVFFCRFY